MACYSVRAISGLDRSLQPAILTYEAASQRLTNVFQAVAEIRQIIAAEVLRAMRMILTCSAAMLVTLMLQPSTCMAAPPTDACALLTPAQVSGALGGSVGPGKALTKDVCQWSQQGKLGDVLLKLDVNLVTLDRFTRLKTVTLGTVTNIGGLGDDAFYSTLPQGRTTLTTLNIKKGDAAVVIRVFGGTKPAEEYQAKEKAVAVALIPKL